MYQSNTGGPRRVLGTGLAVGALQLGIGLAVVSAFAGGAITKAIKQKLDANNWAYMPPQPRPDPAPHSAKQRDDTVVIPQSPMPELGGPVTITPGPIGLPPALPGDDLRSLTDFPLPQAPAQQVPTVAAHALGDPGTWITPNDYPFQALREGWRGVTRLHLVIDSTGHVSSCAITVSSGHEALDAVACAKVSQRAHFSPARDGTGAPHEGTYDNAIHWEIQEVTD